MRTARIPRRKHLLVYWSPPPCPRVGWWENHRRIARFGLGPYMRRAVRSARGHLDCPYYYGLGATARCEEDL